MRDASWATLLVTSFGPFEGVVTNRSRCVAEALVQAAPPGWTLVHEPLPTAYARGRSALEAAVARVGPRAIVALGVAPGPEIRLETRAEGVVTSARPDVDGVVGAGEVLGPERACAWPLEAWAERLRGFAGERGLEIVASRDCGTYVCNATYHAALGLRHGSLFVHLPQGDDPRQTKNIVDVLECVVATVCAGLVRQLTGPCAP